MFLAAVLRVSNPSQPNTVTEIRYSSRNSTVRDHAMITGIATKHQLTRGWRVLARYSHP